MNILSIDTASSSMSICIISDDIVRGEINLNNGLVHSTTLMPCIESLFDMLQFDKKSLDLVTVCVGPGSFTGIRIGVATANAISLALGIPVISVGSLEALAMNFKYFTGTVITTFDAQRDSFYVGCYHFLSPDNMTSLLDNSVMTDEELENYILSLDGDVLLAGQGVDLMKDYLSNNKDYEHNVIFADYSNNFVKASNISLIGKKIYEEKNQNDANSNESTVTGNFAVPVYMRKSQAEIVYDEKHKNE